MKRDKNIKELELLKDSYDKMKEFYFILLQLIYVHQQGMTLAEYFISNRFERIAIYGTKELGLSLMRELRGTEIRVDYFIDKNDIIEIDGIKTVKPEDNIKSVDVIVVTSVHYFSDIREELRNRTDSKVVSIEDVIFSL